MKRFLPLLILLSLVAFQPVAQAAPRIIHVFVALCDNDSQGIVPVPKKIGNGNDPDNNLYWGCGYGVRTFFSRAVEWKKVAAVKNPRTHILERLVFKHKTADVWLVADAYKGDKIKDCTVAFLQSASGNGSDTMTVTNSSVRTLLDMKQASLVSYVGHDGLMDFTLESLPSKKGTDTRDVIILACISRTYFREPVKTAGANPLLWTTGLMCPEAYTLKAAIDGWILKETGAQVRERAAQAYNQYLKCGIKGARGLFATGW